MTGTPHDDDAASAGGEPASPFDAEVPVASTCWTFDEGRTRSLEWRYEQLDALAAMLTEHGDRFSAALAADLGKSATEAWTTELGFSLNDIAHQRKHLADWATPRKVRTPLTFRPGRSRVIPEPKGVALIIAPWNYPLQLLIAPMAAAIAAETPSSPSRRSWHRRRPMRSSTCVAATSTITRSRSWPAVSTNPPPSSSSASTTSSSPAAHGSARF